MKLTPEDIAYLRAAAARDGYSADDALKVFQHESSLRPDAWGGKGGKYFGLFQAGGPERAQYGVDTEHPSAANQIDAFGRFLRGRGFKPGMGIADMYSTVLAGSPGHYNRSDGAGTVAQHVAQMTGATAQAPASAAPGLLGSSVRAYAADDAPKSDPITELLNMQAPKKQDALGSLISELTPQEAPQKTPANEDFVRQMMDLHRAQHLRAIQGLL